MNEDFLNPVNEGQEDVVDSQAEEMQENTENQEQETNIEEEQQEETQPQTEEENRRYASIRRKAEEEAKLKFEKELEAERQRLEAEKQKLQQMYEPLQKQAEENKLYDIAREILEDDPTLSEQTAIRLARYELDKHQTQQKEQQRLNESRIAQQKAELRNKPFFNELESEINTYVQANPSIDLKTLYNYLRGERMEELMEKAKKDAQQRTIADIQDNQRRGVVSGGSDSGSEADYNSVLTPEGLAMAKAFGNDPKKLAKYVKENKKRR